MTTTTEHPVPLRSTPCQAADCTGTNEESPGGAPPHARNAVDRTVGINPNRPNAARMYDYLLEGQDNFAADRDAVASLLAHAPDLRKSARDNRRFLHRALEHLAAQGYTHYLDLGCGLPARHNVHQLVRHAEPDSHVIYVDNDPMVAVHGRALLARDDATFMVECDVRDVDILIHDRHVQAMLRSGAPVAVLATALFHYISWSDDPAGIIARLRDVLPPGSAMVFSHAGSDSLDPAKAAGIAQVYAGASASMTLRSRAEIRSLLGRGWRVADPGFVDVNAWLPDAELPGEPPRTVTFFGGVAHVC